MRLQSNHEYHAEHFVQQDFSGFELENSEFDSCTFSACDFSETSFRRCNFVDCNFEQCNLSLVTLGFSKFSDVSFRTSKLVGIDWTKVDWPHYLFHSPIRFDQCNLNDNSFFGLHLQELSMVDCKAHNLDLREGDFNHADFSHSDFSYSLFDNTNLSLANFAEACHYDIDIHRNKLDGAKFTRFEAVRLLENLGIELLD